MGRKLHQWRARLDLRWLLVTAAVAIGSSQSAKGEAGTALEGRDFLPSSDPDIATVEIQSSGGLALRSTTFQLFGDGRLIQFTVSAYASGTPQLVFEDRISPSDLDSLVADIVLSGLMEFDPRDLIDRFTQFTLPTDETTLSITIRLDALDERHAESPGGIANTIVLEAPQLRARQLPDVVELAAIARLVERVGQLQRQHRRIRR